jgi:hypothetical protein
MEWVTVQVKKGGDQKEPPVCAVPRRYDAVRQLLLL